jgi:hypothetical protein
MDREEATRALELLRKVVDQARDDTALQNWGVIWIVHAFTNGGGFALTNLLVARGIASRWPYATLWSAIVVFNIGAIFVLKSRRAGAKTFIESQIWAIWLTFIGAVILVAVINDLLGQKLFFLGPVIGTLSAVGFAQMGAVMGRRWYLGAILFAAASLAMAAAPASQFLILGVVWGVAQLVGGVWLETERRRRLAAAPAGARLL